MPRIDVNFFFYCVDTFDAHHISIIYANKTIVNKQYVLVTGKT